MWGQRDYQLYPLSMVIPSIEEEVEVEEDGNGLVKDPQKGQMEDWEWKRDWRSDKSNA